MRTDEAQLFDRSFLKRGLICGVDEAGRGCLAGPVVAAAVVFDVEKLPDIPVDDSKALSPRRREELFRLITEGALDWAVGVASWRRIDRMNIRRAALFAMERAVSNLKVNPTLILIDGNAKPASLFNSYCVVKGDARSFSIAAASIVAKVVRDGLMRRYARIFPQYGFESNKGYPTRRHIDALLIHGPSPIHRLSFRWS